MNESHNQTDLEIRHFRLVRELAATGSATRAAERLHVTQSAVSHQLREIEARLGTPLFLRLGKRMRPTPAGERLLTSAAVVLGEVQRAEEDVRRFGQDGSGIIRVCAQCQTGYHWLPSLLRAFEARYPHVDVRIAVESTMNPLAALLDGKLDLAIVTQQVTDRRVRVRPLFTDSHAVIVAPSHPLATRAYVTPAELARETLALYSASAEDSLTIRHVLRPAGVKPSRVLFVQLTEAIIEMVKARLVVSVLPTWSIRPALRTGAVIAVPLTRNGVTRQWSAATLAGRDDPPYLSHFIDLLAERALPARMEEPVNAGPRIAGRRARRSA
jgi:LysR family transcriptional regulator for metE and metH